MLKPFPRRAAVLGLAAAVGATLATASIASGGVTPPQLLLAASSFIFGYVVIRLSESMLASDPERRQHAQRRLILAAAIPALVLTPAALESSASEYRLAITISGLVWMTLAMAYTSFLLARGDGDHRPA